MKKINYEVTDIYEEPELLGYAETLEEARKLRTERIKDTDGECHVLIFDYKTGLLVR